VLCAAKSANLRSACFGGCRGLIVARPQSILHCSKCLTPIGETRRNKPIAVDRLGKPCVHQ
jgi:hypothetical protein